MKVLGIVEMGVGAILPDKQTMRHARKSAVVRAIAADIPAIGILHDPIVRKVENATLHPLLAGNRRYAAAVEAGLKLITVKLVECTDDEAALIRGAENGHRDTLTEKQREAITPELVELRRKILAGENGHATLTEARAAIAEERGIQPGSVEKSEQREKKRRQRKPAVEPEPPNVEPEEPAPEDGLDAVGDQTDQVEEEPTGAFPLFDTKGQEVEKPFLEYVEALRQDLDDVELYARRCAEALERIGQRNDPMLAALKGAEGMTRQLQQTAQSLIPMSICDCLLGETPGCAKCHGNCWLP